MKWFVFFAVSLLCFLLSVIFAVMVGKSKYKSGRILDPIKILFIGVILSATILFLPIYMCEFKSSICGPVETFLIAAHNMIRLFVVDGEFSIITTNLADAPSWLHSCYSILFSILFVMAPILTFGFVMSFFKNLWSSVRYMFHYTTSVYIFSELNEKSLALANSLEKKNENDRLFVFVDVYEKDDDQRHELIEKAKELGAILFKKDVVSTNFSFHHPKSDITFFAIAEDQSENISQALKVIEKYKYRENTNLYVFSTLIESEMLLSNAFNDSDDAAEDTINIKVRRVNEVQSLISRNLYENGFEKIFSSSFEDDDGIKKINAVVIGMGRYGTEMTKALSWFCQMDGYLAQINSFDISPLAEQQFNSLCPELMKFSGVLDVEGETKYTIKIHSGVNVETVDFDEIIAELPRTTYVFVSLGDDEKNITAAVKLRALFARMGYYPQIQAVVYNSEKSQALAGITNFKGQAYDIDFIGDINSSYSEEVILNSDVEMLALARHLKWGKESDFWRYDYNRKSSIASAIHRVMKDKCGIEAVRKAPEDRTEEELWSLRILEHCRWNAYMRSEGYVYGGTVEPAGRNDLAKMHNCLVPFAQLPLKEQEKDDD